MAKTIAVGQPVNDAERRAIAYLRDHLPLNYTVIHNVELPGKENMEIDLVVLAPHCVYVVDVKGVRGSVDIYGTKWYPQGRQPYTSPLLKGRQNAKILKALLTDDNPTHPEMKQVYVRAAVLLTAPDASVIDHSGIDGNDVVHLSKSVPYFQNKGSVPEHMSTNIQPLLAIIEKTIRGKARPPTAPLVYRDWQVEEKLGGNDSYTEYRARHIFTRKGTARLRVYRADPYQDEATREREKKLISNAFRSVSDVPGHPNILSVREFFASDDESYFVLVTEDIHGDALRQHIKKPALALTFGQKLRIIRDVLGALDHAHNYHVIHRNLTPDAVLVGADGRARLSSFEYARAAASGTSTIAKYIVEDLDQQYQAPECFNDPGQASVASDLFSAGLVFYELLTGDPAFTSPSQIYDTGARFPVKASELKPDLPPGLDEWLQRLCAFEPQQRFNSAAEALRALNQVITPSFSSQPDARGRKTPSQAPDKRNLPREYVIDDRFVVQQRLGQGGFATAYKVFDSLAEVMRVLKLVLTDRISVYQRLRQEYKTLEALPPHPYVVKSVWAGRLSDATPYIVFEYVDGLDVEGLIQDRALSLEDSVELAMQVAEGLAHIHAHGVYHQDIKPSNLLWTDRGVRIIDFNVAVSDQDEGQLRGGTIHYIPPDLQDIADLSSSQKADRDVYALGVTLYQCITGRYPFDDPGTRRAPVDPRRCEGCEDLNPGFVALLLKAISPSAAERFPSAGAFLDALKAHLSALRQPRQAEAEIRADSVPASRPNYNSYVSYLLTLYSQSARTNAGTRGLDAMGERIYVATRLDKQLQPAILRGDFRLVIISGNAGDGKTAFIQRLAKDVERQGVVVQHQANGFTFTFNGRSFVSNYDGSQDEGDRSNNDVLLEFLAPFQGQDEKRWSSDETRLIAINEGRLVDFLTEHQQRFPRLVELVRAGLNGVAVTNGIAVINLNLRSIVADQENRDDSIFDQLLQRMTARHLWQPCESCDLKQRCYIYHNARTFMDPVAGPKTTERLKALYTISHLRGRLHITLRDLRSSLAYMLAGTRDCDEVHALYQEGSAAARQEILNGFYFNAWMGGTAQPRDRLISLLREIDVGEVSNPDLDRDFDFQEPTARAMARFAYAERSHYDDDLLSRMFRELPRDYSEKTRLTTFEQHRNYVAMLRRRHYFERRDENWRAMLPYQHFDDFFALIKNGGDSQAQARILIQAINRGEGLIDPTRLGDSLALRVRTVERGTIQSYRLFDGSFFTLTMPQIGESARFIEYLPQSLSLYYRSPTEHRAELRIHLDIYEMLMRLNRGYRPNPEELQGFYLSLMIFKNVLASAPYQEVLLTETGHEFYRVSRSANGVLTLEQLV